jgi:hypothetical protein
MVFVIFKDLNPKFNKKTGEFRIEEQTNSVKVSPNEFGKKPVKYQTNLEIDF